MTAEANNLQQMLLSLKHLQNEEDLCTTILEEIKMLVDQTISIGNDAISDIDEPIVERYEQYVMHYQRIPQIKDLALLYRDCLFQSYRAQILFHQHELDKDQYQRHKNSIQEALSNATEEIRDQCKRTDQPDDRKKRQLQRWKHMLPPWDVYRDQLTRIKDQSTNLQESFTVLLEGASSFDYIQSQYLALFADQQDNLAHLISELESLLERLEGKEEISPSKMQTLLNEYSMEIEEEDHSTLYEVRHICAELPSKHTYVVDIDGGMLLQDEIDLKRAATHWLEVEINPTMQEIVDFVESAKQKTKLMLDNLRNQSIARQATENPDQPTVDFYNPILQKIEELNNLHHLIVELAEPAQNLMRDNFNLSDIIKPDANFLPITLQHTIRQLGGQNIRWLQNINTQKDNVTRWFRTVKHRVEQEESTSTSEKVSRYIQSRGTDPECHHYLSVFATKGFVGSSFAVGRKSEHERIQRLLGQWRQGFRGSAILTGPRHCGKTFLGEWLINAYVPPKQLIELHPSNVLDIAGRKLETKHDLGEALGFIKKYGLDNEPLLWIDDLELWHSHTHPLGYNLEALTRFCDQYSNKCFVLVSLNKWAYQNYHISQNLNSAFLTSMDLDKMSMDEIQRAILIRHGATHQKLFDKEGIELKSTDFQEMIKKITRATEGNIGEAMMWWSTTVRKQGNKIFSQYLSPYQFPPIEDLDEKLIIDQLVIYKRMSDYELRQIFGPSFAKKYRNILRRLLSSGIIQRRDDGLLQIRDSVVNKLGKSLDLKHKPWIN